MQQFVERMWYQGHKAAWLLLPLAWLYAAITALRRLMFRFAITKQHRVAAPVIVVGNISVGGTGKTPFTLALCKLLQQQGWQPGIISRGYGAEITKPTLVAADGLAEAFGDEPLLLAQRSGCPVVVCPDRVAAARFLLANTPCNIVISDDGLQHYRLARDVEIVLIDGVRGLGNGLLIPAGPLREGKWRLDTVNLVVANSKAFPGADGVMQLKAAAAVTLKGAKVLPAGSEVSLVAGIGNPQRFVQTVQTAGIAVAGKYFFPDHHHFCVEDFKNIAGPVLMTDKDAVKCLSFSQDDWYRLPVEAEFDVQLNIKLNTILANLRSSYGN